jgi:hypothetical protein
MPLTSLPIRRRVATATLWLASGTLAGGCLPSGTEPGGVTPLEGQWDISGQAAAGTVAALQGVLTIRSTSAVGFAGTFDALETTGQGVQRRLSGPLAGRLAGVSTVEFDVVLPGVTRRHVAARAADTVRGSWFDVVSSGAVEASGTFRAVRR